MSPIFTHSFEGFKRDLYGSYLVMLKCVTQKVLIDKRVKVLYLRPLWALIETFTVTKQNPVRVSNETRSVKVSETPKV